MVSVVIRIKRPIHIVWLLFFRMMCKTNACNKDVILFIHVYVYGLIQ